jgi:Xaa-Pro aminopeptidase
MNESTYKQRRDGLLALMQEGAAVLGTATQKVRSNDTEYPYRQNSDFHYLTGFEEDNAVLVLVKGDAGSKSVLFVQPKDESMELWTGKRTGVDAAKALFDVDEIHSIDEFADKLPELLQNLPRLYGDIFGDDARFGEAKAAAEALRHKRETKRPVTQLVDATRLVRGMRLIKSGEEIALIRAGLEITGEAHHHAMRVCRPGMMEYALQAEYEYTFTKNGAYSDAYTTIVAGGDHANTLHYIKNDAPLKDGELVLIDAGCEYRHYATDITRTFPVGGRFSPAQKEVYEAVLEVQEAVIAQIGPGILKSELHKNAEWMLCEKMVHLGILSGEVEELVEEKKHKKYFPHGIGHWLGIDVHDPAPYYDEDGEEIPLASGMVLTIEPGLYLSADDPQVPEKYRGIGIRIEDDILVTETGYENLSSNIAKSVEAVERMCGSAQN